MLEVEPWFGHFAALDTRDYQFSMTSQGKTAILPYGSEKKLIAKSLALSLAINMDETLPDGKIVSRQIIKESLTSDQEPTTAPQNLVYRGKVTRDAEFEAYIEQDRGVLSFGGKILSEGSTKGNPLKFVIRLNFPAPYKNIKDKDSKVFEKRIRRDDVRLEWIDGKRHKFDVTTEVENEDVTLNGPGIANLEASFYTYQDKKIHLAATGASAMTVETTRMGGAMKDGFTVTWTPDPKRDPEGKSRLVIKCD